MSTITTPNNKAETAREGERDTDADADTVADIDTFISDTRTQSQIKRTQNAAKPMQTSDKPRPYLAQTQFHSLSMSHSHSHFRSACGVCEVP